MVGVKRNMNSVQYCQILEDALAEPATVYLGENWIFVRYNALVHTSKYTRSFLNPHNIKVLDWLSRSSDLGIIEYIWGCLAR